MALASQSGRGTAARRFTFGRRRARWKKPAGIAVALAAAAFAYSVFVGDNAPPDGDVPARIQAVALLNVTGPNVTQAGSESQALANAAQPSHQPKSNTSSPDASHGGASPSTSPSTAPSPPQTAQPAPAAQAAIELTRALLAESVRFATSRGQQAAPPTRAATTTPPPAAATATATSTAPAAAATTPPRATPASQTVAAGGRHTDEFNHAMALIRQGNGVDARARLSRLLTDPSVALTAAEAKAVRDVVANLNRDLVFSPRISPNDPLVAAHVVQSGQFLSTIARKHATPWQLLERVNQVDARRLRAGQTIKVIHGPFHAVVHKRDYRMDLFLDAPGTSQRIYIRSFDVGLGENDSTPPGMWLVAAGRKLVNPPWTNPRTGEFFAADDPANPIGDRWIGLKGIDDRTRTLTGYGIHGTIEPDSIGKQRSMGCVRLLDEDVAWVYDLLEDGKSTVEIRP